MVVAISLPVEVEGKPTVRGAPSPSLSEAPRFVAEADAASEFVIAVVDAAVEVIAKWLSFLH